MAGYPRITIAGVDLDDASGRWDVLEGTGNLPGFPGRTVSKLSVPGQPGYVQSAYAPTQARAIPIVLRFNAVDNEAGVIVSGHGPRSAAISKNMDLFFQATALGASGYDGLVEVRHYTAPGEYRRAVGSINASSSPSYKAGDSYALVTLLFDMPGGLWEDPTWDVTGMNLTAGQTADLIVPSGSAPSWDNFVAFKGPLTWNGSGDRATIVSNSGNGFAVGLPKGIPLALSSTDWVVFDTTNGTAAIVTTSSANGLEPGSWEGGKSVVGWTGMVGRTMGPVLHIVPGTGGSNTTAKLRVHRPNAGRVVVRSRKRWY